VANGWESFFNRLTGKENKGSNISYEKCKNCVFFEVKPGIKHVEVGATLICKLSGKEVKKETCIKD